MRTHGQRKEDTQTHHVCGGLPQARPSARHLHWWWCQSRERGPGQRQHGGNFRSAPYALRLQASCLSAVATCPWFRPRIKFKVSLGLTQDRGVGKNPRGSLASPTSGGPEGQKQMWKCTLDLKLRPGAAGSRAVETKWSANCAKLAWLMEYLPAFLTCFHVRARGGY